MSLEETVSQTAEPRTTQSLLEDLKRLGIQEGMTVIVHSSLSSIGWVCGNEAAVVQALLNAVGNTGTLVMPSHSSDYSDPANWENPPVPESWWQTIRDHMPPFDPEVTPASHMGRIAECFRACPETRRSQHPAVSFCARGPNAKSITRKHPLEASLGAESPLGKLYKLDARILLLGVGHEANTSLHLAEYISGIRDRKKEGAAIARDGKRVWTEYFDIDYDSAEFPEIGRQFEFSHPEFFQWAMIGSADSKLLPVRKLVDFAAKWYRSRC